jgi:uncharacterized membrane protein
MTAIYELGLLTFVALVLVVAWRFDTVLTNYNKKMHNETDKENN